MVKVLSREFGKTEGWTVVNDHTIHEGQKLSDGRPFMRTRVPKRLQVKVSGLRVVENIEWAGDNWIGELEVDDEGNLVSGVPKEEREEGYEKKRWISGKGNFDDKITIFSIPDGALMQFRSFKNIKISPLPSGMIGGKHKATVSDGIGFSGMSSRDIPEGGLMKGEPGKLWLDTRDHDPEGSEESLNAELYLDEEQFDQIFSAIRDNVRNIEVVHLGISAELFEGEVQASLSEWWHDHEYGLLKKGEWVQTPARLERVSVAFSSLVPADLSENEKESFDTGETSLDRFAPDKVETLQLLKQIKVHINWIVGLLAALCVLIAIK